MIAMMAGHLQ
jgi:hypothetical protein